MCFSIKTDQELVEGSGPETGLGIGAGTVGAPSPERLESVLAPALPSRWVAESSVGPGCVLPHETVAGDQASGIRY